MTKAKLVALAVLSGAVSLGLWACAGDDDFVMGPTSASTGQGSVTSGSPTGSGASTSAQTGAGGAGGVATTTSSGNGGNGGNGGSMGQGGFDPLTDPTAQINHPGNMECRVVNMSVPFTGVGSDPQDGTLTGSSLVWTCSIDGQIGTGTMFMFTPTTVGAHIITLAATDMDGNVGTDTITLNVQQSCP